MGETGGLPLQAFGDGGKVTISEFVKGMRELEKPIGNIRMGHSPECASMDNHVVFLPASSKLGEDPYQIGVRVSDEGLRCDCHLWEAIEMIRRLRRHLHALLNVVEAAGKLVSEIRDHANGRCVCGEIHVGDAEGDLCPIAPIRQVLSRLTEGKP